MCIYFGFKYWLCEHFNTIHLVPFAPALGPHHDNNDKNNDHDNDNDNNNNHDNNDSNKDHDNDNGDKNDHDNNYDNHIRVYTFIQFVYNYNNLLSIIHTFERVGYLNLGSRNLWRQQ